MRFGADRAKRHCASGEALDDFFRRLNVIQSNRLGRVQLEFKQTAQGHVPLALVVDDLRIFLVGAEIVGSGRMLQLGNRIRRPHVLFAAHAKRVFTTGIERMRQYRIAAVSLLMQTQRLFCYFDDADAFNIGCSAFEIFVDKRLIQADRFENLRAAVRHVSRYAHFRHHLQQTLGERFLEILDGFFRRQITR